MIISSRMQSVYEGMINTSKQQRIIEYLSDDNLRGRATGTLQAQMVAKWLRDEFERYGLKPAVDGYYYQQFVVDSVRRGRNVVAMVPSRRPSDEYIIVGAHYDHIGSLNGYVYNGADDNASGVAVLLTLAEMYSVARNAGWGPDKNIIFVAFDAKEKDSMGAAHFVKNLPCPKDKIIASINIDQIGTTLEPLDKERPNPYFLIALGENYMKSGLQGMVDWVNWRYKVGLSIDHKFYGSEAFTEIAYNMSDQIAFRAAGIPCVYFTSGFHSHTYKTTDDPDLIDYPVLAKRTLLIFYVISAYQ